MFYRHGWHSWSPTRWVDPTVPPVPVTDEVRRHNQYHPVHPFDTTHGSHGVTALERGEGIVDLIGSLGGGGVVFVEDGEVIVDGPHDWFTCSAPEDDAFAAYAEALGDALGRRGGTGPNVWCSWYSHFTDVTEQDIVDAVDGYADMPFDVIQIDDGWQRSIGDWMPNGKFAGGMSVLADRIRQAGKTPGLWLAPFIAHESSEIATDHPEMLVHDTDGNHVVAGWKWGGAYFPLDITRPAAVEYITESIRRAVDWGFEYLKLDFLYALGYPGERSVLSSGVDVERAGAEVIRQAAGESVYLLACGAPILSSIGFFDGIRIGPDVGAVWEDETMLALHDESAPGARAAITTSALRTWLQPVIDIDPDVVYFRSDTGSLSPSTKQLLRDLALICSFRATSDPPASLTMVERTELDAFLRADPAIAKTGRYSWNVDGRMVDFRAAYEHRREPGWQ